MTVSSRICLLAVSLLMGSVLSSVFAIPYSYVEMPYFRSDTVSSLYPAVDMVENSNGYVEAYALATMTGTTNMTVMKYNGRTGSYENLGSSWKISGAWYTNPRISVGSKSGRVYVSYNDVISGVATFTLLCYDSSSNSWTKNDTSSLAFTGKIVSIYTHPSQDAVVLVSNLNQFTAHLGRNGAFTRIPLCNSTSCTYDLAPASGNSIAGMWNSAESLVVSVGTNTNTELRAYVSKLDNLTVLQLAPVGNSTNGTLGSPTTTNGNAVDVFLDPSKNESVCLLYQMFVVSKNWYTVWCVNPSTGYWEANNRDKSFASSELIQMPLSMRMSKTGSPHFLFLDATVNTNNRVSVYSWNATQTGWGYVGAKAQMCYDYQVAKIHIRSSDNAILAAMICYFNPAAFRVYVYGCAPGSYYNATTDSCSKCSVGYYNPDMSTSATTACQACPFNSYNPSTGGTTSSACVSCPAGTCAGAGSTSSAACVACTGNVPCPTGLYNNGSVCVACPYNTYQNQAGQSSCNSCPSGTVSQILGATSVSMCTACGPGKYAASGASVCSSCPAGSYSNGTANNACTSCPTGTYSLSASSSQCTRCTAGTYSTTLGASSSSVCVNCKPGTYSTIAGSSSCTNCSAGTWANATVSGASSADVCTKCKPGYASSAVGSTDPNSCTACLPGSFSTEGSEACVLCPAGSWSNQSASPTCTRCEKGKASPVVGATSMLTCQSCNISYFSNATGLSACYPCPAGTYASQGGLISLSNCTKCTAGYYSDVAAAHNCANECSPGYSSSEGATSCTICAPGTYASQPRSASCSLCSFTANKNAGATSCISSAFTNTLSSGIIALLYFWYTFCA